MCNSCIDISGHDLLVRSKDLLYYSHGLLGDDLLVCSKDLLYRSHGLLSCGHQLLTLNAPITTKVVCFSRLLKCLRSLYGKQCGPRSDCSHRSSLFWVHAVCFYTRFVSNARQLFAADDFSRRHFQMHFFLGALRVKSFGMIYYVVLWT